MQIKNGIQWFLTFVLWIVALGATRDVVTSVDSVSPSLTAEIIPLIVFTALYAVFGTMILWGGPEFARLYRLKMTGQFEGTSGKAKREDKTQRNDKMSLLMDLMDDDELAAFKTTLKQRVMEDMHYDDGELPYDDETLVSLLDEGRPTKILRR